jgi:phage baseplate assembly protein W
MRGTDAKTGKTLSGVAHLRQSIRDILTTPLGSRVMRRDYGSRLFDLVDNPLNDQTLVEIFAATAEALMRWEPRLKVLRVQAYAARPATPAAAHEVTAVDVDTGVVYDFVITLGGNPTYDGVALSALPLIRDTNLWNGKGQWFDYYSVQSVRWESTAPARWVFVYNSDAEFWALNDTATPYDPACVFTPAPTTPLASGAPVFSPNTQTLIVSGTFSPAFSGVMAQRGSNYWSSEESFPFACAEYDSESWSLSVFTDAENYGVWTSDEDVPSPDLVVVWTPTPDSGTIAPSGSPTITVASSGPPLTAQPGIGGGIGTEIEKGSITIDVEAVYLPTGEPVFLDGIVI